MNKTPIVINRDMPDTFEFPVHVNDTIFTLACSKSFFKENINNIISKILTIRELKHINMKEVSKILEYMRIEKLNIFSIDSNSILDTTINFTSIENGSKVNYIQMNPENFIKYLNIKDNNFQEYNTNSMYILRNGSFIDIKRLFTIINDINVNIGRWRGSKISYTQSFRF